ncbi:MAG TPA: serine/threonine-protein kinase [Candidatus Saccharimonadia bacterium]|nr:serine/threonine-protein kinase [Candidatus Saccharimonadia bacterium]
MNAISERWKKLEALFDQALELEPSKRAAWLAVLDVDDDTRRELAGMLDADAISQEDGGLTGRFGAAIASAAEVPVPGERIGPFRLLREIGSGGVGVVFLAERADDQFHQEVAIKVIRGVATGDAIRQLRHERQILAGFDHPEIARLLDGGATPGGLPYLAMEFIRGAPITDACQKLQLPQRRRLELLAEVARAVHYAHQRLVIHRDIKPANVLLRDDGRPVLLDFGIAKLIDEKAQRERLATQPWFTPAYAAPEQRRGGAVSTATDIYALGLLLFELLTDQRPILDVEQQLIAPSLAAPEARRATLRGDLDRIVALATQDEPGDRYPSADALARDIERYLAGQPVRAAPDRASYRLRKFVTRHRFAVAAAFAAIVLLASAAAWLVAERDRALAAELRAERQSVAADAVTSFLVDLFREGPAGSAASRALTPVALIDRGRERMRGNAQLKPGQRARLAGVLGQIYLSLGEPRKAIESLEEGIAEAREEDAASLELATMLSHLGIAQAEHGDRAAAQASYEQAVEIARANGTDVSRLEPLSALESRLRAAPARSARQDTE